MASPLRLCHSLCSSANPTLSRVLALGQGECQCCVDRTAPQRRYRGVVTDASTSPADGSPLVPVLQPEGWALLRRVSDELGDHSAYRDEDALRWSTQLRREGHDPETVAAVLTQLRLRARAVQKFGPFTDHMLFTDDGLQQATRLSVAARHAQRFQDAGVSSVADLGCGLGADALAMAALELDVTAVEMDEATAAAATINLMPFPNATVACADALDWHAGLDESSRPEAFWLDPARRVLDGSGTNATGGSARLFDPEAFSPPLSFVERLADTGAPVGVKLGPGLPHTAVPDTAEAQWISVDGALLEAVLWFNSARRAEVRRGALVVDSTGATSELVSASDFDEDPAVPVAGREGIAGYLYEPDAAVIRSGLIRQLVADTFGSVGGRMLDEHIAYFCADESVSTPFATGYRVLDVLPYSVKGLRRWVQEQAITRLDIKKRGVDVVPEELRRLLMSGQKKKQKKSGGPAPEPRTATLVLTRVGEDRIAVVVEPV